MLRTAEGGAVCTICGKAFTTLTWCKEHILTQHVGDKTLRLFACHVCGKSFAVERYRKDHVYRLHGIGYRDQKDIYHKTGLSHHTPAPPPKLEAKLEPPCFEIVE